MKPVSTRTQACCCGLKPAVIRLVAWLCVVIQCLFPVATTAGAGIAAARAPGVNPGDSADIRSVPETLLPDRTTVYRLGPLESAHSVADRYGLSTEELRRLNQLRTFARGFDNVRQGDELDVPLTPRTPGTGGTVPAGAQQDGDGVARV